MSDKSSRDEFELGVSGAASASAAARLCYVDDSRTSAFVVRRLLQPYGYQVDHFLSAEPAFVALIQENYDLLLTDLKVSSTGMDGDDLIRTLRQSGHPQISALPIIVITGATDAEVLVDVYNAGANQVMNKPVDADELDGHICRLLSERRSAGFKAVEPVPPVVDNIPEPDIPVLNAIPPVPPVLDRLESDVIWPASNTSGSVDNGSSQATSAENTVGAHLPNKPTRVRRDNAEGVVITEPGDVSDGAADIPQDMSQYPPATEERFRYPWRVRGSLVWALLIAMVVAAGVLGRHFLYGEGIPVEMARVEVGQIHQSITVSGQVVSKQRVNVTSTRAGRVVEIIAKQGDRVEAGQVLARLDERELSSHLKHAQASLNNAQEDVILAERALSRLGKADSREAAARSFVEDAEVDLHAARIKAGIAVEEVHSTKLDLENQRVIAPFAGIVTTRYAEIEQWAEPSETLFILADEGQREIEVRVDAADSVAIDVGQMVVVSSDAFPGLTWQETVVRLETATDIESNSNSNSVKVYISLGDDAPLLHFEQPVDADIRIAWNPNALKVPFEALINRDNQTLVAVMLEGRVRLKPVETGIEDFVMTEIKQGLDEDEIVILAKGRLLQDGDRVYRLGSGE